MKLIFDGFEHHILLDSERISVLEIADRALFARTVSSLATYEGANALEQFSLWSDDDKRIKPKDAYMMIHSPLDLPWGDRKFYTDLLNRYEQLMLEEDDKRIEIEGLAGKINTHLLELSHFLECDYLFNVEWNIKAYLKALKFNIDYRIDDSLIDNLIAFMSFLDDIGYKKTLCFVNLKIFLKEKEINYIYDYAFSSQRSILLLENIHDEIHNNKERKYVIDQDFIETVQS